MENKNKKLINDIFEIKLGISLKELKKQYILKILEKCENNKTHAAKIIGVSIRTIQRIIK